MGGFSPYPPKILIQFSVTLMILNSSFIRILFLFIVVSLKNFVPPVLNYCSIHNMYLFHILNSRQVFVEIMQNKVNGIIQLCVVVALSTSFT